MSSDYDNIKANWPISKKMMERFEQIVPTDGAIAPEKVFPILMAAVTDLEILIHERLGGG